MQQITPLFKGNLRICINCPDEPLDWMRDESKFSCKQQKSSEEFSLGSLLVFLL